jgi:hypothetical protein
VLNGPSGSANINVIPHAKSIIDKEKNTCKNIGDKRLGTKADCQA